MKKATAKTILDATTFVNPREWRIDGRSQIVTEFRFYDGPIYSSRLVKRALRRLKGYPVKCLMYRGAVDSCERRPLTIRQPKRPRSKR